MIKGRLRALQAAIASSCTVVCCAYAGTDLVGDGAGRVWRLDGPACGDDGGSLVEVDGGVQIVRADASSMVVATARGAVHAFRRSGERWKQYAKARSHHVVRLPAQLATRWLLHSADTTDGR